MNRDNASILKNEETRFAIKWEQFFFSPANSLPLTIIRILAGIEMMFLWWSWSPDLQQWFGPNGLISQDLLQQWRGGWAFSIFDRTTTESSLWAAYGAGFVAFFMLTAGVATTGAAVAAIFFWISLLHRGPMLAGSADDVMTIVLFCLVIGPSGAQISVDRMIGWNRQELVSWRAGLALSLLKLHAVAITASSLLAQLRGDVWWDGTAAWWMVSRIESSLIDLTWISQSQYLINILTHAITAFEFVFIFGVWNKKMCPYVAGAALVCWPLIGLLAGEIPWGIAMAILSISFVRAHRISEVMHGMTGWKISRPNHLPTVL